MWSTFLLLLLCLNSSLQGHFIKWSRWSDFAFDNDVMKVPNVVSVVTSSLKWKAFDANC